MVFTVGLVRMGDIFSLSKHGGWTLALLGSGKVTIKPD